MTTNTITTPGFLPSFDLTASTRPNSTVDGIRDHDKQVYSKILKSVKIQKKFWTERQNRSVSLGLPTLSANRWPDFQKVLSSLKEGYDAGVWQDPVVVAVPGKLIRDAVKNDPNFAIFWDIRECGFHYLAPYQGDPETEWYLQVCDGRHRQTLEAAKQGIPEFDTFDELREYKWDCQVTFWRGVWDATTVMQKCVELYLDLNKKKIRKPSQSDCLGAEYQAGNTDIIDDVKRLEKIGVYVEGGKRKYGDKNGLKTKYGVISRIGLHNPMLNDTLLSEAVRIIRSGRCFQLLRDPSFQSGAFDYANATLIVGLAHALRVCKQITHNGCKVIFESWLADELKSGTDKPCQRWNDLGGNQDNKNAESVALGVLLDFRTHLKFLSDNKLPGSSYYNGVVEEQIRDSLFPKK
jgi:hypothetical protein